MGDTWREMAALIPRLNDSRSAKNLMEAFPKTIQFDLQGEEGSFSITIAGGQMTMAPGVPEKADILVVGDSGEFAKVARGKLDVTHPIAHGHITIEKGKVSEMTLLNRILWATGRR
jgi:putative sterol carrier protein